ncbi:hypothetical protein GCM10027074_53560 [Streptomyces deserti]
MPPNDIAVLRTALAAVAALLWDGTRPTPFWLGIALCVVACPLGSLAVSALGPTGARSTPQDRHLKR